MNNKWRVAGGFGSGPNRPWWWEIENNEKERRQFVVAVVTVFRCSMRANDFGALVCNGSMSRKLESALMSLPRCWEQQYLSFRCVVEWRMVLIAIALLYVTLDVTNVYGGRAYKLSLSVIFLLMLLHRFISPLVLSLLHHYQHRRWRPRTHREAAAEHSRNISVLMMARVDGGGHQPSVTINTRVSHVAHALNI